MNANQITGIEGIIIFVVLFAHVGWCLTIGRSAEKKGRSGWSWFWIPFIVGIIACFVSGAAVHWALGFLPWTNLIFSIVIACLSETDSHRRKRIEEEERIRRKVWEEMSKEKESLIDKYREP